MSDLVIRRRSYDHPDAVTLVERVQQVYVERYGSADPDHTRAEMFVPPQGAFYVGYDGAGSGATPVASGAWRHCPEERLGTSAVAELKRMYVVPEAQRRGHARTLLAHLERTAAEAGYEALVLATGPQQPEAIALYRSAGYVPVEPFGHFAAYPDALCLGRRLGGGMGQAVAEETAPTSRS